MFDSNLLNRRSYFHLLFDRGAAPEKNGRSLPGSLASTHICARYSSCLAMTSLLAFGRRCHPASSVFLLASSLDFLQGTFEKIHFHRLLGEHSLQLMDLLTVGRRVRAGPRGIFSRLDGLEFNAPLVQASPGHPQLLRQL